MSGDMNYARRTRARIKRVDQKTVCRGYTREHYPDYVEPYNWFYGGFTYKINYLCKIWYFPLRVGYLLRVITFKRPYVVHGCRMDAGK